VEHPDAEVVGLVDHADEEMLGLHRSTRIGEVSGALGLRSK
jgi:hypothetical protein